MYHYPITGITSDSRKVKPGFAFVAIPGEKEDGHNYIEEAIKNGAQLIYSEEDLKELPVPLVKVRDSRRTLSQNAAIFFNYPAKRVKSIGITGTNGKSTTASLLHYLLYKRAGIISTIGSSTGNESHPPGLTTPGAVEIHSLLAKMVKSGLDYAVIEVSSHGIHQQRVAHVDFKIKVLTGISADHLDYHRDFQDYLAIKRSFFTGDGVALFNRDDPYYYAMIENQKRSFFTYGLHEDANIRAVNVREKGLSSTFTINQRLPNRKEKNYQVQLPLPGRHNIYNGLAAFGAALLLGQEPKLLIKRMRTFPGVWRRMQIIKENGFTIIDDCAHNPGSYSSLFSSIKRLPFKKLIILNAIRGNRGDWINRENAKVIGRSRPTLPPSSLYITSARDIAQENDQVKREEERTFLWTLSQYPGTFSFTPTFRESLMQIKPEIKNGDLLLVLGAHAFDEATEAITQEFSKG